MQRLCDIRRVFINRKLGKVGHRVVDLVEPNSVLTLDRDFIAGEFNNKKTLFKEIEVVPMERVLNLAAIERMAKHTFNQVVMNEGEFIRQFIELFEQSVYHLWDTSKAHLVLIAPDYGSAIVAKTIANLVKKNGEQWLGRTFFISLAQEHERFDGMLEYLGFNNSYRVRYEYDLDTAINFQTIWRYVNGAADYPDNQAALAIEFALKIKNIFNADDHVQVISAGFFDQLLTADFKDRTANPILDWFEKYYYSKRAQFWGAIPGQVVHPMLDEALLNLLLEVNQLSIFYGASFKILKAMDDYLAIPEMAMDVQPDYDDANLLLNRIDDYKNSWYCSNCAGKELTAENYWVHWTAASWCRWLMEDCGCLLEV